MTQCAYTMQGGTGINKIIFKRHATRHVALIKRHATQHVALTLNYLEPTTQLEPICVSVVS